MIENVDNVIGEMQKVVEMLWKCNADAYQRMNEYVSGWQVMLQEMMNRMCRWMEEGNEIPLDIIACQMENFEEAVTKKDDLMLADVLQFEFGETLKYYKGLLEAYDGK